MRVTGRAPWTGTFRRIDRYVLVGLAIVAVLTPKKLRHRATHGVNVEV
jgi:hypothetical protein